jgi:G:T-mismatch repair DNA endonuclease (very short patch repair protein)
MSVRIASVIAGRTSGLAEKITKEHDRDVRSAQRLENGGDLVELRAIRWD